MERCKNCDGSGLAGAGDRPWEHQGRTSTCTKCNGTGQVEVEAGEASETTEGAATGEEPALSTPSNEVPVKRRSILGWLGL